MNPTILGETFRLVTQRAKEEKWIAEKPSSYSDLLLWHLPHSQLRRSRNCVAALALISIIGMNPVQINFLKTVIQKQSIGREGGQWSLVRVLLKQENMAPGIILSEILNNMSPEEFFGNCLPLIIKQGRMLQTKNPYLPNKKKVKKPQRKRGYDDKGSLRPLDHLGPEYFIREESAKVEEIQIVPGLWYEDTPLGSNNQKVSAVIEKNSTSPFTEEVLQRDKEIRIQIRKKRRKLKKKIIKQMIFISKENLTVEDQKKYYQQLRPVSWTEIFVLLRTAPLGAPFLRFALSQIEEIRLLLLELSS